MDTEPAANEAGKLAPSDAGSWGFEVEELGRKDARWRLEVRPGDLALFEGNDPQPFAILRMVVTGIRHFRRFHGTLVLHSKR